MTDTSKPAVAAVVKRLKADNDWLMRIRIVGGELQALHAGNNMLRSASLISALEAERDEARTQVALANDPAYLATAIDKVGMVDKEWKARAETAEALNAILQARLQKAAEALEPFANAPSHGLCGGPMVQAVLRYEDGTDENTARHRGRIDPSHFRRARSILPTLRETTDDQT